MPVLPIAMVRDSESAEAVTGRRRQPEPLSPALSPATRTVTGGPKPPQVVHTGARGGQAAAEPPRLPVGPPGRPGRACAASPQASSSSSSSSWLGLVTWAMNVWQCAIPQARRRSLAGSRAPSAGRSRLSEEARRRP